MALSRAELARYLSSASGPERIVRRPEGAAVPLSLGQEQIWLHGLLEPDLPLYNETVTLLYRGALQVAVLERCLQELIRRHEIWRTNIRPVDSTLDGIGGGIPRQRIHSPEAAPPLPCEQADLSGLDPSMREAEAERLATEAARRPFDLAEGSLLRVLAVKLDREDYRIFLTLHHMVFDGVSIRQVFLPELIELYTAGCCGQSARLPDPELQYGDYACRQRSSGAPDPEALAFWKSRLADLPALALPTDRPRTPSTGHRGALHRFRLDPRLTAALRRLARQQQTTLFHVLLAGFVVLLARSTGEQDIALGTIDAGRTHLELESIPGYFLNTVVLRFDLSGEPEFREVLRRVRAVVLDALAHAHVPYQEVVRQVGAVREGVADSVDGRSAGPDRSPDRSLNRSLGAGLVSVVFAFQPPLGPLPPEWALDALRISNGAAKFDLHVELEELEETLVGRFLYNTDLFDAETIVGLTRHWFQLFDSILIETSGPESAGPEAFGRNAVASAAPGSATGSVLGSAPGRSFWTLPMLDAVERQWLVEGLNPGPREYPQLCLPQLFARQAAQTPERIAVGCQGQALTYAQLDRASSRLAAHLAGLGLESGPGSRLESGPEFGLGHARGAVIALLLPRGLAMLTALLAILKTGAAYVPLDPVYPPARLAAMLRGSGADLLITSAELRAGLPEDHPRLLVLDPADWLSPDLSIPDLSIPDLSIPIETIPDVSSPGQAIPARAIPEAPGDSLPELDRIAYILFTSGSTGEPKGVAVTHRGLTNLLWSMRQQPGITEDDTLLAVTSLCFDIAALELFLPLIAGARVEIATAAEASDPHLLREALERSQATILQATPGTWRMLVDSGWTGAPRLKALCGGEAMAQKLAAALIPRTGSLWNMYGPTETTIWSACCRVTEAARPIPLGAPIANTRLFVLDAHQQLLPPGVPGELYIGGDGLAAGYWGNPAATASRFPVLDFEADGIAADGTSTPSSTPSPAAYGPQRLYRTGDRVVRQRDGSLRFLGRTDKQIKLRGFRIELGDVEQAVNRLPGVAESVVLKIAGRSQGRAPDPLQPDQTQDEMRDEILVAYLIPAPGAQLDLARLRRALEPMLPRFMQPSILCPLDRVPLTPNGKLDRSRLPDPFADPFADPGEGREGREDAPRPGTEEALAAIWRELLQVERVGRHDDFFSLGGHSLLAVRLAARIEQRLGQRPALATLIHAPTIARLARALAGDAPPAAILLKAGAPAAKPLFWIGSGAWLRSLARYLHRDQTLYTVTIGPESLPLFAPAYRMEEMAAWLVRVVREVQPEGPYCLGGFCMDALLAYEMAQQLRAQGEEVGLLVIGDVFAPGSSSRLAHMGLDRQIRRELANLLVLLGSSPRRLVRTLRERLAGFRQRQQHRRWRRLGASAGMPAAWRGHPSEQTGRLPGQIPENLLQALFMAEAGYRVQPYSGRVLFLEAAGSPLAPQLSTAASWSNFISRSEVFTYPGEHMDLQVDPCLGLAAEHINSAIEAAAIDAVSRATADAATDSASCAECSSESRLLV